MRSIIGQCAGPNGGGMSCLTSFMIMAVINIFFDILSLMQMIRPFTLVSFILHVLGTYMAYQVFKMMCPEGFGSAMGMGGGQQQDDGSGGGVYQRQESGAPASQQMAGREMSSAGSAAPAGFTPFSGGGQRL